MNHFRKFAVFIPFALVFALLLAACDSTEDDPGDPTGKWEAAFVRQGPESESPANVRITLNLGQDKKCAYAAYWNDLFINGFDGGWSLKADSLYLTATVCYKGDTTGTQFINDCDEDLPARVLAMFWNGAAVSWGEGSARIVFHRKAD